MSFLNVKNRAESTLASDITDVATSLTLASGEGAKFPTTNFHITIDDEILLCSSRSTDTLTVVREKEGTTGASHSSGAAVELRITAEVIDEKMGNPLTTQGDILIRGSAGVERLGYGTTGQVLTTKGTGVNPVWESVSAAKISNGSYNGNSATNRAVAHGLGVIPKIVLISKDDGSYIYRIFPGLSKMFYLSNSSSGTISVTSPTSTNFYVGKCTDYNYSANESGYSYKWTAIG